MPAMNNINIPAILELPVQERIRLVELIWDSVAAASEAVEISPELKSLQTFRRGNMPRPALGT